MKKLIENFKKHLSEGYCMESDYEVGSRVSWNALERVEKTTTSGRIKIDYARISRSGEIVQLHTSDRAAAGNATIMDDETNSTFELPLCDLVLIT